MQVPSSSSSRGAPGAVVRGATRGKVSAASPPGRSSTDSYLRSSGRTGSKGRPPQQPQPQHAAAAGPSDPFAEARESARQLGSTAWTAGLGAIQRLQGDTLRETFGISGGPAHAQAAEAAAEGAKRYAARMLTEAAKKDAEKKVPLAVAAMPLPAASPANPGQLVEEIVQSLGALRRDAEVMEATAEMLTKAIRVLLVAWDPSSPTQRDYATRAMIYALIDAEVARMRRVRSQNESKWASAVEEVANQAADFQRKGFAEKAACCSKLLKQMTDGLRGLAVQRMLKAAAVGIDNLSGMTDSQLRVDFEGDPMLILPLAAKMHSNAQVRMGGLIDVVEREVNDADYWATRGRLPDGEEAPKLDDVDVLDIWEDISGEEALLELDKKIGAPLLENDALPVEDAVVAAMQRISALSTHAGETLGALGSFENLLLDNRNAKGDAADACRRVTKALEGLVRELSEFHEGLLEALDADADDMADVAASWNLSWHSDSTALLSEAATEIFEYGPRMGGTSKERGLLRAVRGLAMLVADPVVRKRIVSIQVEERMDTSEKYRRSFQPTGFGIIKCFLILLSENCQRWIN